MSDELEAAADEPTYEIQLHVECQDNRTDHLPYSSHGIVNGGVLRVNDPDGIVYYSSWYWKAAREVVVEVDSEPGAAAD